MQEVGDAGECDHERPIKIERRWLHGERGQEPCEQLVRRRNVPAEPPPQANIPVQLRVLALGQLVDTGVWHGQSQLPVGEVAIVGVRVGVIRGNQYHHVHDRRAVGREPGEDVAAVGRRVEIVGQLVRELLVGQRAVEPRLDRLESDLQGLEQRQQHDAGIYEAGLQDGVELQVTEPKSSAEGLGVGDGCVQRIDRGVGRLAEVLRELPKRVVGQDRQLSGVEVERLSARVSGGTEYGEGIGERDVPGLVLQAERFEWHVEREGGRVHGVPER